MPSLRPIPSARPILTVRRLLPLGYGKLRIKRYHMPPHLTPDHSRNLRKGGSALTATSNDLRTEFYEIYRDKAEEHDREFVQKYNEDLNNTLIFVGFSPLFAGGCADRARRLACFPQWLPPLSPRSSPSSNKTRTKRPLLSSASSSTRLTTPRLAIMSLHSHRNGSVPHERLSKSRQYSMQASSLRSSPPSWQCWASSG
jgi:hypothetical protein